MRVAMAVGVLCAATVFASNARAQDVGAAPQDMTCAYMFSSGNGESLFRWCLTQNGNVVRLETPEGQHHRSAALDGYAICSAQGLHGADYASTIPVPFGPATVVSGCTGGSSCTISRDTTDGIFRLIQKFTQDPKQKEINVDHTLINLSASAVTDVQLVRLSFFSVNNGFSDLADASARSAWMRDIDRVGMTAATYTKAARAYVVVDDPVLCLPVEADIPAPPGAYGAQVNYDLGTLRPLKKTTVRVQYRRD